jgi:TonB family protein
MIDHVHALPEGYQLQEYVISETLGFGGFGITYLARDTHLNKLVAIKEYLPSELAVRMDGSTVTAKSQQDTDSFDWGLRRFLDEARTVAQFDHPNIVKIHRFFEQNGTGYIVMEFIEGRTLSDILKRFGTIPEQQIRNWLWPIIEGLKEVHAAGYLHRDIKPQNIMIRNEGRSCLLDFGAARLAVGGKTRALTSVMTPGFAPLEQYSSKGNQGPWTDIYSLGAVMHLCITGKRPEDAIDRSLEDSLESPEAAGERDYTQNLLTGVKAALALREVDRPQNLNDWLTILDGHEQDITAPIPLNKLAPSQPVSERPTNPPSQPISEGPTSPPSQPVSEPPTSPPSQPISEGPTSPPSQPLSEPPSSPPSQPVSEGPTSPPSQPLSEPPSSPPSQKVTEPPSRPPSKPVSKRPSEPPPVLQAAVPPDKDPTKKKWLYPGIAATVALLAIVLWMFLADNDPVTQPGRVSLPSQKYSFTILPAPVDATVTFLNVQEDYQPRMRLAPGSYHVEVSRQGYATKRQWVEVKNVPVSTNIVLERDQTVASQPRPQASDTGINVTGSPQGAIVLINGTFMGRLPAKVKLNPGTAVTVRVEADGYQPAQQDIRVPIDQYLDLNWNLTRAISRFALTIETKPADATVKILNIGPRYTAGMELEPGNYEVELARAGYKTQTLTVAITDRDVYRSISLTPERASLVVEVTPADATLTLVDWDEPFQQGMDLPLGTYQVRASRDGYAMQLKSVRIAEGSNRLEFRLEKTALSLDKEITDKLMGTWVAEPEISEYGVCGETRQYGKDVIDRRISDTQVRWTWVVSYITEKRCNIWIGDESQTSTFERAVLKQHPVSRHGMFVVNRGTIENWNDAKTSKLGECSLRTDDQLVCRRTDGSTSTLTRESAGRQQPNPLDSVTFDFYPKQKVAPVYPNRALSRGQEGECLVEFTITRDGKVRNPFVVKSQCLMSVFEEPSIQAVLQFEFEPKIENGRKVEVSGIQNRFVFKLE